MLSCALFVAQGTAAARNQKGGGAVDIGGRLEPFLDRFLIDELDKTELRMTEPIRREVVLTLDKPWEGPASAYYTVLRGGNRIRLYYRGYCPSDIAERQVTCCAESADGVHFERPVLRLYEFNGSLDNNIVYRGVEAHNFAPFLDANPRCKQEERYKAVAGVSGKLYAFSSPDGLHWRKMVEEPVLTKGAFDSLNVAFWDTHAKMYRCYSRSWTSGGYEGVRAIQSCTSSDFIHWTAPQPNVYAAGVPLEHFYTNATVPCPGAAHILLSFPKRFVPERTKLPGYPEPGVSDAMFMTSRDGVHWDRTFLEAWLRPGPDQRNWTQRSNMPAWGVIETGDEYSLYVSEHYDWPDNRLRRVTIPRGRLASLHAGASGGSVLTRPLAFVGHNLYLNYATSAAGSVTVELLRADGSTIDGFGAADFVPLFGDEFDVKLRWHGGTLADARENPIRIRIFLKDADVYAIRTGE
jgi:hypothetical protein